MKYIKRFEDSNNFEVGDYVTIKQNVVLFSEVYNYFLKTHIGIVNKIISDDIFMLIL